MSDTTDTETETETNTDTADEPSKAELHERVEQLESTVEKLMPSRRDALRMGAAGLAGAVGLGATSQSAEAATGSAGEIGDPNNRPDLFADTVDANATTIGGSELQTGDFVPLLSFGHVAKRASTATSAQSIFQTDFKWSNAVFNIDTVTPQNADLEVYARMGGAGPVQFDARLRDDSNGVNLFRQDNVGVAEDTVSLPSSVSGGVRLLWQYRSANGNSIQCRDPIIIVGMRL
jgi:hypothetical protein